jgi:hypothetical protein
MDDVPTSIPAAVGLAVLRWAGVTIELTEVAAARGIGVPDDRFTRWVSDEAQPTIAPLKKASTACSRSRECLSGKGAR